MTPPSLNPRRLGGYTPTMRDPYTRLVSFLYACAMALLARVAVKDKERNRAKQEAAERAAHGQPAGNNHPA